MVTPALTLAFGASPFVAWWLARSERRHTFVESSDAGKGEVIGVLGALGTVLVVVLATRVLVGVLVVLDDGLALVAGMAIAAAWELWRGTFRVRQTPTGAQ